MPKAKASFCVIAATFITVIVLFVLPITPKVPVSTAVVERGSLVRTQSVEGLICYRGEQPCLSPVAGQVAQVYVAQGQAVLKGDPLVRLDTTFEEQALKDLRQAMYQQEQAVLALSVEKEAVQAVWMQNKLSMETQIRELSATVEAKTLRAPADGVVGQVYAVEAAYVAGLSPMLSIHAGSVELKAQQRVQESASLQVGTRAVVYGGGAQQAVAVLTGFDVPAQDSASGLYTQTLRFDLEEGGEWLLGRIGDRVSIEILSDVQENVAIAPIAAVSESSLLWLVQADGKVTPVKIDPENRDEDYVRVPEEYVGQRVVLLPDEGTLRQGTLVKESKK